MKLLTVYQAILEYGTMTTDERGFVQDAHGPDKSPILVDGKQLVLPYPEQLKNFNPNEKMIFHPMAENIFKGESDVIKLLKRRIMVKTNITTALVFQALVNILASPDLHSQMNPQQAELFNMGMDADAKTLTNLIKIMTSALKNKDDRGFVSSYLNRGASYNGKRCTRVNVVSFPFYEQLTKEKEVPNGLPIDHLRVKDKECLTKLYEFMFPDLNKPEAYNYGTNNTTVPYLDALLMGSTKITSRLNDLVEIYKDYIADADNCVFATEWYEDMQNVEALKSEILRIPVQHGSDGSLEPQVEQQAAQAPIANVPQMSTMPVAQQPQRPTPAPVSKGKVSFGDAMQNSGLMQPQMPMQQPMYPQQMQQPVYQQPMQQPMYPQQQMMQQPMYPQQVPMQQMYQPQMYPQQQMPMQQPMYPQMQQPMYPQPVNQSAGWPQLPVTGMSVVTTPGLYR